MKRALIPIDFNVLKDFISTGAIINAMVEQGIPADAKLIDVIVDKYRANGLIQILIESETLEDVVNGELYPYYNILFSNIPIQVSEYIG